MHVYYNILASNLSIRLASLSQQHTCPEFRDNRPSNLIYCEGLPERPLTAEDVPHFDEVRWFASLIFCISFWP